MEKMEKSMKKNADLEAFLAKDTENFTNTTRSLAYKSYLAEKLVLQNKQKVFDLEKAIDSASHEFNEYVKSLDEDEQNSGLGKFAFARKKKKLVADAENKLEARIRVLSHNLETAKKELRTSRRRYQELLDQMESEDINWNELKRILMEKIAQGFFDFAKEQTQPTKEPGKQIFVDTAEPPEMKVARLRRKRTDVSSDGGRTFKEKNVIGKYDFYKLKGLTDEEFREYKELLKHILYNDEECLDPQTAWLVRFALLEDKQRRLRNLALNTSNVALYNGVIGYFMRDGGMTYQRDFDRLYGARGINSDRRRFFHEKAHLLMAQSGFSERFINRNCRVYARELELLFSKPSQIKAIFNRISQNLKDEELISKEFENEVKREIQRRLEMKRNLAKHPPAQMMVMGKR